MHSAMMKCISMLSILLLPILGRADDTSIAVIVSAQSNSLSVSAEELAPIYWRKKLYDNNGKQIRPANLNSENPLRLIFSQRVLHSNPKSQIGYWNGLYFHGTQPPYTVESQEAMIRYVATTENAIGYIDACKLDERVRPILWISSNKILTESPSVRCIQNPF